MISKIIHVLKECNYVIDEAGCYIEVKDCRHDKAIYLAVENGEIWIFNSNNEIIAFVGKSDFDTMIFRLGRLLGHLL